MFQTFPLLLMLFEVNWICESWDFLHLPYWLTDAGQTGASSSINEIVSSSDKQNVDERNWFLFRFWLETKRNVENRNKMLTSKFNFWYCLKTNDLCYFPLKFRF